MKEIMVSLDIVTRKMLPQEFLRWFGIEPSLFEMRELEDRILWRAGANLPETATLIEQVKAIFEKIPTSFLPYQNQASSLEMAFINVGVLHDTVTCTVDISYDCIELIKEHGVGIQVSCYPSE